MPSENFLPLHRDIFFDSQSDPKNLSSTAPVPQVIAALMLTVRKAVCEPLYTGRLS